MREQLDLENFRAQLPRGSIKQAAENLGFHRSYLDQVLAGKKRSEKVLRELAKVALEIRKQQADYKALAAKMTRKLQVNQ